MTFRKNILTLLLSIFCTAGIATLSQAQVKPESLSLIPQPVKLTTQKGGFLVQPSTKVYVDPKNDDLLRVGEFLAQHIEGATGHKPEVIQKKPKKKETNLIYLTLKTDNDTLGAEGYTLDVKQGHITLAAKETHGIFLGIQTMRQLLPAQKTSESALIPALQIVDKPRYIWRGMHLDVTRHFFPVEFVKQYIDYLAMHKLNSFHWHLTDDQGWRIEIKKYPKLTEVGAWRDSTLIGHYWDLPQTYRKRRHGGYYTQEQIKEVVKYAQDRFINVVPEIEMPGHALAALAAYPELSCTGGPHKVESKWGIFPDIFCAGNEQTFTFLENVLTEVMELFPSKVIHVGGDEAPKTRWKVCPKCQKRIADEGLKDEHELQSYFVQRMEKFANKNGRIIIGWDEILEGGLAPNAYVMSWRGTKGGIAAAKEKHYVVMSPGTPLYFDYYQGERDLEPTTIHGYNPLSKVYAYDPTPSELSAEEKKYILGAQANMWTEYVSTEGHLEYMVFPRISALSEVLWTPAKLKDWKSFQNRMTEQYKRYDALGVNYARSAFNVIQQLQVDTASNRANVTFETDAADVTIHYTLDGSEPNTRSQVYKGPFSLNKTATIKAGSFVDGKLVGKVSTRTFEAHKALNKNITLTTPAHQNFASQSKLVDGLKGSTDQYDGHWVGFLDTDVEAIVDLGKEQPIKRMSTSFMQNIGYRIFLPVQVEYALSVDGIRYVTVDTIDDPNPLGAEGITTHEVAATIPLTRARFVKVKVRSVGVSPDKYPSVGQKTWLMLDEIVVE
ncbi:family 20 glycosylhydrolase [Pontibacter sp. HSC-14F20]|uniref:beta-N-acetylhexosaminidase n=1 Tax=Pontibacter sp. HSC-14F20 TaxID=2864136 RepID=UPI001C73C23B|nr:family 20 glycosylhydrolase [Pontibacter sp. HSC-14F20]MBX0332678.1 family 20 glycosylhydrolase [Pontibacter sp. HSC-14F20]